MKKHHFIFVGTLIFIGLFYDKLVGINLSIFALIAASYSFFSFKSKSFKSKLLYVCSIFSAAAFAWFGDFISFLAILFSLYILQFQNENSKIKPIQFLPLMVVNLFASLGRFWIFKDWIEVKPLSNKSYMKLIALAVIPFVFIIIFFIAYSFGSEGFASILQYEFDLEFIPLILTSILGFYVCFGFINYWIPEGFYQSNHWLTNEYRQESRNIKQPSFSFLDLDFERKSGEISLIMLNLMLIIFIGTYNYEQFFKIIENQNYSAETHQRVNAVMVSIIMAVGVILFYFKREFNLDLQSKNLKILAKIWIILNGLLIMSCGIKNTEYILNCGLTYKRLGVYAFLLVVMLGLVFTFLKIKNQKTNAYLFNQMTWVLYVLVLTCSFINWGNIITKYNINVDKTNDPIYLCKLEYNDKVRREYFKENKLYPEYVEDYREDEIFQYQERKTLSKVLYYEFLN
jgi:hypothetical protein